MQDTKLIPADLAPVIAAILTRVRDLRDLGVTGLYIYGSRARGDHHADSDLDVMIDYDPGLMSLFDMMGVQNVVADETGFETHVASRDSFRSNSASSPRRPRGLGASNMRKCSRIGVSQRIEVGDRLLTQLLGRERRGIL